MIDPSGTREDDPVKHSLPPSPPLRQAVMIASSRGTLEGGELFASLQSPPLLSGENGAGLASPHLGRSAQSPQHQRTFAGLMEAL